MIEKGAKVRDLRPESYWFNEIGTVISVDKSGAQYPIVVRFTSVNYSGIATNNFHMDELKEIN